MTPARSEVANVIAFIKDSLTAAQLYHAVIQDEANFNVFTVAAYDDDYINSGIIGWHEAEQRVVYLCHDPLRDNHARAEGLSDEENRCWWDARSAAVFLMHLDGSAREAVAKYQDLVRAAEKELDTES